MPLSHCDYTVACICPMGVELAAVKAMLDQTHPSLPTQRDQNCYILGEIEGHNIVIAVLPEIGTNSAATVATQLLNDFSSIRFGLLVGIGGGVPDEEEDGNDIRLGDVVISKPTASFGGVVQYDLGKYLTNGGFEQTGVLTKPPLILRTSVEMLVADHRIRGSRVPQYLSDMLQKYPAMEEEFSYPGAQHDQLFQADYPHPGGPNCHRCDLQRVVKRNIRRTKHPKFHYGTIGSANTVVKDAGLREELRRRLKIICVEMEAAGLMDSFPCLVIRGICDYADSHKNKKWQPYAAATAAAYMKELLSTIPPKDVARVSPAAGAVHIPKYDRGLNLFDAPNIDDHFFIGRDEELEQMEAILLSGLDSPDRKVLVLGGMGGIGKTQMAIHYAKRRRTSYSSIFWLNAASESSLKGSFRILARRILPTDSANVIDDDQLWTHVSNWFSELDNTRWLLIFDNYDDPHRYNIERYYPYVSHGSIIITTRLPDRLNGRKIKIRSMNNVHDGLRILATRSDRAGIESDAGAHQLVERLDGFPLALATAGAFLKRSSLHFTQYVELYNSTWNVSGPRSRPLPDYRDRTLYTTWNISFTQIETEDPNAAQCLKLLAYFDNQNVWYELLHAGANDSAPLWFIEITKDVAAFESVMSVLTDYCFVECQLGTKSYGLHACVHDWLLSGLNETLDERKYSTAFDCIANSIDEDDWEILSTLKYRRIASHAIRLGHTRFRSILSNPDFVVVNLETILGVAELLREQTQHAISEVMYQQALAGYEKALGPDHRSTLSTVHSLGILYGEQGKLAEAEQMYVRALAGYEKALGPDHTSNLNTVHSLGILYRDQGKLAEAEQMFIRALAGYEKALGPDHTSTLNTVHSLGILYGDQGKLAEAEQMYVRALAGYEKALGPSHTSTIIVIVNYGNLSCQGGRLAEAEWMYQRALTGMTNAFGSEHPSTLGTVNNLGNLRCEQGEPVEAEQMYRRALVGLEKARGQDHTHVLGIVNNLGVLFADLGKRMESKQMYERALNGFQHSCGADHPNTVMVINNLERLQLEAGKYQTTNVDEGTEKQSRRRWYW